MRLPILLTLASLVLPAAAHAAETVTYSYDALGRLTNVARSGSVNNGVNAAYAHDSADNRINVTVTGSSFATGVRVMVLPLKGVTVIPLGRVSGS